MPEPKPVSLFFCYAPEDEPLHATLHERLLPDDGDLPLHTLLADLEATGTAAPLGVEVFSDVLHGRDPVEVGRLAGASLRDLLATG